MSDYKPITWGLRNAMSTENMHPKDGEPFYLHVPEGDFCIMCETIDIVHKKLEEENERLRTAYNDGFDVGFASADDWLAQHEDAMAEHGWVRLPKDGNGEYIRIGDVMEWCNGSFTVHELKITEDGWQTWDSEHGYTVHADECIHRQPDTWERIIEDAVNVHGSGFNPCWTDERDALVARCKALCERTNGGAE